mmetsp:Transcript_7639/g.24923  ORF Transcript_7639/g.24923 Transcript_7639/m.24923 type:complete len:212 (-) Transcript_7639:49-684(-)
MRPSTRRRSAPPCPPPTQWRRTRRTTATTCTGRTTLQKAGRAKWTSRSPTKKEGMPTRTSCTSTRRARPTGETAARGRTRAKARAKAKAAEGHRRAAEGLRRAARPSAPTTCRPRTGPRRSALTASRALARTLKSGGARRRCASGSSTTSLAAALRGSSQSVYPKAYVSASLQRPALPSDSKTGRFSSRGRARIPAAVLSLEQEGSSFTLS